MDYKNLTDEELLDLIDKSFFNYLKFIQRYIDRGSPDSFIIYYIRLFFNLKRNQKKGGFFNS